MKRCCFISFYSNSCWACNDPDGAFGGLLLARCMPEQIRRFCVCVKVSVTGRGGRFDGQMRNREELERWPLRRTHLRERVCQRGSRFYGSELYEIRDDLWPQNDVFGMIWDLNLIRAYQAYHLILILLKQVKKKSTKLFNTITVSLHKTDF